MRENQKPLDFLSSLFDESLFEEFVSYAIANLCDESPRYTYGLEMEKQDPITGELTITFMPFEHVVKLQVLKAKEQIISDMAAEIVQKEDLKYKAVIVDHYYTSISYLASKIDVAKHLVPYPFVKEIIISLKTTLDEKYQPMTENNTCTKSKFQWLGNTNVLTTLFHDLLYGQNKKPALLVAKEVDIKKFLLEHFIDKEGNTLSSDTINKYFSSSQKHAKSGDKIVLP